MIDWPPITCKLTEKVDNKQEIYRFSGHHVRDGLWKVSTGSVKEIDYSYSIHDLKSTQDAFVGKKTLGMLWMTVVTSLI
jgi:hypothetical protein